MITKSGRYYIIFVNLADLTPPKLTNGNYDGKNHFFDVIIKTFSRIFSHFTPRPMTDVTVRGVCHANF